MNTPAARAGRRSHAMTVAEALAFAEGKFVAAAAFGDRAELRGEARALLRIAAGLSDAQIYSDPGRRLAAGVLDRYMRSVARRAAGEPLAYIEQSRGFHAIELHVNPSVLVPRPETEIIVDTVIARAPRAPFAVVDLGTGSGAIALGIARACADARVSAVDISAEALVVARGNAARLGLSVEFVESDWFERLPPQKFEFVCCNPPYVRSDDPHLEALRYEPRLALDGGSDGLREIARVLAAAPAWLAAGGSLLIEHGHDQAAAVASIAAAAGLQRDCVIRDLGHLERVSVFRVHDQAED